MHTHSFRFKGRVSVGILQNLGVDQALQWIEISVGPDLTDGFGPV